MSDTVDYSSFLIKLLWKRGYIFSSGQELLRKCMGLVDTVADEDACILDIEG